MRSLAALFQHPFISFAPYPVHTTCLGLLVLYTTLNQFLYCAQNSLNS